jgi:hypothetical protein
MTQKIIIKIDNTNSPIWSLLKSSEIFSISIPLNNIIFIQHNNNYQFILYYYFECPKKQTIKINKNNINNNKK